MSRVKGVVITTGKMVVDIDVEGLAEKQSVVAGLIQAVVLSDGSTMWVNEEGKLHGLHFNSIATDVARLSQAIMLSDAIVGNVLVVGPPDNNGNDTDITTKIRRDIARVAREA